jgi:hypothetical protein
MRGSTRFSWKDLLRQFRYLPVKVSDICKKIIRASQRPFAPITHKGFSCDAVEGQGTADVLQVFVCIPDFFVEERAHDFYELRSAVEL